MSGVVFLDTVGLIAIWDRAVQWHGAARTAYSQLVNEGAATLTTSHVFLECGNAAARKPFRGAVVRLKAEMEAAGQIILPETGDWLAGWSTYAASGAAGAGIVDCISFAVMRRLGVMRAFTNDRHFQAAGFETLF